MGATSITVLILAILPSLSIPGNPDDKLLHVVAFAVLAFLAAGSFPQMRVRTLWIWLVGFAAAIELGQLVMRQGREADWVDLVAGIGGTTVGLILVFLVRQFRSNPSS